MFSVIYLFWPWTRWMFHQALLFAHPPPPPPPPGCFTVWSTVGMWGRLYECVLYSHTCWRLCCSITRQQQCPPGGAARTSRRVSSPAEGAPFDVRLHGDSNSLTQDECDSVMVSHCSLESRRSRIFISLCLSDYSPTYCFLLRCEKNPIPLLSSNDNPRIY